MWVFRVGKGLAMPMLRPGEHGSRRADVAFWYTQSFICVLWYRDSQVECIEPLRTAPLYRLILCDGRRVLVPIYEPIIVYRLKREGRGR
jgi:hypothetical protein